MKFEQMLTHFDMGISVEQLQKESLIDIALLFMGVDGVIAETEEQLVREFAETLEWNSVIGLEDYITDMKGKCILAVQSGEIDDFIHHRLKHIVDEPKRKLALELAQKIVEVDGVVDNKERHALALLAAEVV